MVSHMPWHSNRGLREKRGGGEREREREMYGLVAVGSSRVRTRREERERGKARGKRGGDRTTTKASEQQVIDKG